ncbi:MAG: hypothetical protein HY825_16175 [Acidobacteria bacterium]|nr:hypothetical protein [Acidobacteriota bacterium]
MRDFAVVEKRERSRERRRAVVAWAVFGVVSFGLHHLALQGLDASGFGVPARRAPRAVMLDLFEAPAPVPRAAPPPPRAPEPPKPVAEPPKPPEASSAAASPPTPPSPGAGESNPGRRTGRTPREPPHPALPQAAPEDESNPEQLTLGSEFGEPYDPMNPQLRMSDWGSDRFAAADRFFDATDSERSAGLIPDVLRSPLEQIGPWNDWGGDAAIAAANDFFRQASDGIQLAINPDRPDVLRYVPVDAAVLAYLNLSAVAGGPHAGGVASLLRVIPDYQTMFGHVEAQLLAHAEELYITSSDPTDRSRTVVLIRHNLAERDIAVLVGRQIALSGGKPNWSMLSEREAVTVDPEHLDATPWLYLFPEPGVMLIVHRSNLGPLVAALEGRAGQGRQPQLVDQLRRLTAPEEEAGVPAPEAADGSPTLFAVTDSGTLGPHLRFVTRALAGADLGELGAGYLRITGGEHPEVLGGLRLAAPEQVPRWQELMQRIEQADEGGAFGFAWAGRDDRVLFRFELSNPVVSAGLDLVRDWAGRYYGSGVSPVLPEADGARNVVTSGVHRDDDAGAGDVPVDPDGERIKDPSDDGGPGAPKDPDAGTEGS